MLADGRTLGEVCREATEEAVEALRSVMADPGSPGSARVAAATALLDRGWGRPRQRLEVDDSPPPAEGSPGLRLVRPGDPGFVEPPAP